MILKTFTEYSFNTDTVPYSSYDKDKINLGYLMSKSVDENNTIFVSPIESRFIRSYEIYGGMLNSAIGAIKYNSNTIWVFYGRAVNVGENKNIFLSEYNISANTLTQLGYITCLLSVTGGYSVGSFGQSIYSLTPSLEFHTGGTVSVSGNTVTGNNVNWFNDGVCIGNRIGFGSTNPDNITSWYEVNSLTTGNTMTIKQAYNTDGSVRNLIISAGTPYVIEDLRIMYSDYSAGNGGNGPNAQALRVFKGLRKELFNPNAPTIPIATTVDNIRATYRLTDGSTFVGYNPVGLSLMKKNSLSEQYCYLLRYDSSTNVSFRKFNVRASLTGLSSSNSSSAYMFATGSVAHNGTNTPSYTPIIKISNDENNLYLINQTRINRISVSALTASSTTFISGFMGEVPPGGTNTYPSFNFWGGHYLEKSNRFYIASNSIGRCYVTPFITGTTTPFERVVHTNNTLQQSTYLDFKFKQLVPNIIGSNFTTAYCDGFSFINRFVNDNNNILYSLPLDADKDYSNITNAHIITPEILTPSATTYDRVYFNVTDTFGDDSRYSYKREIFDAFYRISGISDDTGPWSLINQNGSLSGVSSNSIQFKFTFRTIGDTCMPTRIHGLTITYSADTIPTSTTFYEPSLKNTNISSKIFAWRQRDNFETNIPNLKLDIYNTSNNNLLLTDDVNSSSNGIWQYSTDGNTWNTWVSSADTIGNYIRYSASTLSADNIKIKPILYV